MIHIHTESCHLRKDINELTSSEATSQVLTIISKASIARRRSPSVASLRGPTKGANRADRTSLSCGRIFAMCS